MARPSRTKLERERDLAMIADYYLSGRTQADIAKRLHVSRQQVGYDVKVLQKRWQAAALQKIDRAKWEELAKIDNLEREHWRATASAYQTRFRDRTSVRKAVLAMHEIILPRRLSLAG